MTEGADVIAWLTFPLAVAVIGLVAGVAAYYSIHKSKVFPAVTLISFSYLTFAVLMVLTINYRIFYEGITRFIGAVAMLAAFVAGIVGMSLLFKARARQIIHQTLEL